MTTVEAAAAARLASTASRVATIIAACVAESTEDGETFFLFSGQR